MKVLHINKSDQTGGAALAAVRLLDALRASGTDAKMLVLQAEGEHPGITPLIKSRAGQVFQQLKFAAEVFSFIRYEKNREKRFAFSSGRFGYDVSRHPLIKEADILHFHWINQGFLSLHGLKKLIQTGKPVVWTLHDTWPFTGGCHYPGSCGGFTSACGNCPLLKTPAENDLSAHQHARKEKMYANAAITFVGCSNWMKEMADKSSLVRKDLKHSVRQVFNPVDVNIFSPANKEEVRKQLGLPLNKKLVLFGAANVFDPRKGANLLLRSLKNLNATRPHLRKEIELVAFGKNVEAFQWQSPFLIHTFDVVTGQANMARLYQAADVFVLPSMQDNLPNTVVESLACGTPVVAFNIGGVPEMVKHQQNGFLAAPDKWKNLGEGILYILDNHDELTSNAREFAVNNFSPEIVASRYTEIYHSVLNLVYS